MAPRATACFSSARRAVVWLAIVGGAAGGALSQIACDRVNSDSITLWKSTEKGPGKLLAALGDRSVDIRLRAEAAAALVDIGKADEVEATLGALPAGDRWEVMKALVPLDIAEMKAPAPEKALAFRDALFSLRALAQPEDQARIDAALLPGIIDDLRAGRVHNGRHSVEKILVAMGAPAGGRLAELLGEPIAGYAAVAELLGRIGDDAAREKGAANLAARAGRAHPVPEPMWGALGALGGPAAVKFLEDKIEHGPRDEAPAAVRALQQRRDPAVLPFAMKTAGDAQADRAVRDEMFGVIEGIGGRAARDGLIRIIETDREELVRYRAFEALLVVGKQDGVIPGLEAFPASAPYKKVDVEDLLAKLIEKLGPPVRPVLVKALESRFPLARMTAVMCLEQLGAVSDAAPLAALGKDTTSIKGFPAGETIGKEAARVSGVLRSKR